MVGQKQLSPLIHFPSPIKPEHYLFIRLLIYFLDRQLFNATLKLFSCYHNIHTSQTQTLVFVILVSEGHDGHLSLIITSLLNSIYTQLSVTGYSVGNKTVTETLLVLVVCECRPEAWWQTDCTLLA